MKKIIILIAILLGIGGMTYAYEGWILGIPVQTYNTEQWIGGIPHIYTTSTSPVVIVADDLPDIQDLQIKSGSVNIKSNQLNIK